MHQVYPLEHAFILMNRFLQISKLQSQQETKQAPDLSIILDAVFENNFCLMWNFKRPYRRQSVLWVSKTRRSRLCKTSQTEKTQTLGILHIQKKKKSCKKSNKQEASQKTLSLVPPFHLYLLAFYLGATSSSAASRADQHCLPQQGSLSNRGSLLSTAALWSAKPW